MCIGFEEHVAICVGVLVRGEVYHVLLFVCFTGLY